LLLLLLLLSAAAAAVVRTACNMIYLPSAHKNTKAFFTLFCNFLLLKTADHAYVGWAGIYFVVG